LCGFIEHNHAVHNKPAFKYYPFILNSNEIIFFNQLHHYFTKRNSLGFKKGYSRVKFKISETENDIDEDVQYIADVDFPYEAEQLVKEIREKISYLHNIGISHFALQKLLSIDANIELSRIVINRNYQIFLPEFNNIEIEMTPLPKAVFFLFLKYPAGIIFKDLPDYKYELTEIYKLITSRENIEKIYQSIEDVTNPFNNSINEKCSRIREAFVSKFDDNLAKYYYITGTRSTPKKIIIDRSLVVWE